MATKFVWNKYVLGHKELTPKTTLLMGPLYLICTFTVADTATMLETSTARTSPTSRFFWTTKKIQEKKRWTWLVQNETIMWFAFLSNMWFLSLTTPRLTVMLTFKTTKPFKSIYTIYVTKFWSALLEIKDMISIKLHKNYSKVHAVMISEFSTLILHQIWMHTCTLNYNVKKIGWLWDKKTRILISKILLIALETRTYSKILN